jgi:hypothetical protein
VISIGNLELKTSPLLLEKAKTAGKVGGVVTTDNGEVTSVLGIEVRSFGLNNFGQTKK